MENSNALTVVPDYSLATREELQAMVIRLQAEAEARSAALQTHGARDHGASEWQPYRADGNVKSAHELLAPAGLGWEPEFSPVYTRQGEDHVKADGFRAVVRNDTGDVLGIVGPKYHLIRNATLADIADAIAGQGGLRYGNAGYFRNGARPFLQLQTEPRETGGVRLRSNVSVFSSHDGSLNLTAGFSTTVIVCCNTYAMALRDASSGLQIRHTASSEAQIKEVTAILDAAHTYGVAFDNAALRLMSEPMSEAQMIGLSEYLIPGEHGRSRNAREAMLEAWFHSPGAAPGVRWGAMQAVTYYVEHERSGRASGGRSAAESRAESVLFGSAKALTEGAWRAVTDDSLFAELRPASRATVTVL